MKMPTMAYGKAHSHQFWTRCSILLISVSTAITFSGCQPPEDLTKTLAIVDPIVPCVVSVEVAGANSEEIVIKKNGVIVSDSPSGGFMVAAVNGYWALGMLAKPTKERDLDASTWSLEVVTHEGVRHKPVRLLSHPSERLCLIEVPASQKNYPVIRIAETLPSVGNEIFALSILPSGARKYGSMTVTQVREVTSEKREAYGRISADDLTTYAVWSGPVLDESGALIGLATLDATPTHEIDNFAMSTKDIMRDFAAGVFREITE